MHLRLPAPRVTHSLLATGAVALAALGASGSAAADPASPSASTAIFQNPVCSSTGQSILVSLRNGSSDPQTFTVRTNAGSVSPMSVPVAGSRATAVTLSLSSAPQSVFVYAGGVNVGSIAVPGCASPTTTSAAPGTAASTLPTPRTTSSAALTPLPTATATAPTAIPTPMTTAPATSDSPSTSPTSTSTTSSSTSTAPSSSTSSDPAPEATASSSDSSSGPSPLTIAGGVALAALGLALGGVALYREFRK